MKMGPRNLIEFVTSRGRATMKDSVPIETVKKSILDVSSEIKYMPVTDAIGPSGFCYELRHISDGSLSEKGISLGLKRQGEELLWSTLPMRTSFDRCSVM